MRQIVLDTETTGLETSQDHRIIEIGCVELIDRRITDNTWHHYINPEREIDDGAFEIHGISKESLQEKPRFDEIAEDFINYIEGAELVIHNAPFDIGFLDHELNKLDTPPRSIDAICTVLDTLVMARQKHPGQKNSLDALCRRYEINNSQRSLHGALLDARLLSEVYMAMTGGQTALHLDESDLRPDSGPEAIETQAVSRDGPLPVWSVDQTSEQAHLEYVGFLREQSDKPVWE